MKKLFDFRKPKFLNLDYVNIVVEEKSLFLAAWKSKRQCKVSISPINATYYNSETAIVLKLPRDITELTITLYSFWRKRKYRVLLKKVNLDNETAQHLITKFKPVRMLNLNSQTISPSRILRDTNFSAIVLTNLDFNTEIPEISINTDNLIYTIKTN